MWLIFCCAGLGAFQSALTDNGASLGVALSACFGAILAEFLLTWRKYGLEKIKDGSAAASGMVLALLLPNQIHPVYAVMGALFAMTVVKHCFGGLGANWLNPSLGGWLFIRFSWPEGFSRAIAGVPAGVSAGSAQDGRMATVLNKTVFSFLGAELPSGYIDLLIPESPGIIADRGLLALLVGTVIITAFRISRSWAPAVFLAVFAALARLSGGLPSEGLFWQGDILYTLCSGGTIAAAFMIAAEPSSGAKSGSGTLLATTIAGILSWIFRFIGSELYGCFFALALVNALAQIVRLFETRFFYSQRRRPDDAGNTEVQP
jgi:electron transport complex protein RnfD